MSSDKDKVFVDHIRRELDRHADTLDADTAGRLGALRRHALEHGGRRVYRWPAIAGLATAAVALLAVLVLMRPAPQIDSDWEIWVAQDELEVIEELDFYAWLEATQPSG